MGKLKPRTVWIVAQRYAEFSWYRDHKQASAELLRLIDLKPDKTYIFLSFGVDDLRVDFNDDKAVSAWLADFNPWDV